MRRYVKGSHLQMGGFLSKWCSLLLQFLRMRVLMAVNDLSKYILGSE
ncbi:UNVERIFIED_CONTAM: hypothetical protein ABID98_003760 [Brevibacillus sp. OAP136]